MLCNDLSQYAYLKGTCSLNLLYNEAIFENYFALS